ARALREVRLRVDADELDAAPTELQRDRLVTEQAVRLGPRAARRPVGARVPREGVGRVAERGVRGRQHAPHLPQCGHTARGRGRGWREGGARRAGRAAAERGAGRRAPARGKGGPWRTSDRSATHGRWSPGGRGASTPPRGPRGTPPASKLPQAPPAAATPP